MCWGFEPRKEEEARVKVIPANYDLIKINSINKNSFSLNVKDREAIVNFEAFIEQERLASRYNKFLLMHWLAAFKDLGSEFNQFAYFAFDHGITDYKIIPAYQMEEGASIYIRPLQMDEKAYPHAVLLYEDAEIAYNHRTEKYFINS